MTPEQKLAESLKKILGLMGESLNSTPSNTFEEMSDNLKLAFVVRKMMKKLNVKTFNLSIKEALEMKEDEQRLEMNVSKTKIKMEVVPNIDDESICENCGENHCI